MTQNVAYVTPTVIPRQPTAVISGLFADPAEMVIDLIEHAAAVATVGALGVDAIWIAPTHEGAEIRASLCLAKGDAAADVVDALERWSA